MGDRTSLGITRRGSRLRTAVLAFLVAACTSTPTTVPELLTPGSGAPTAATSPEAIVTPASLDRIVDDTDQFRSARAELVESFVARAVKDERVLAAMRDVPRHAFVPTADIGRAYGDFPVPIGHGQTISQPSLVAQMTELLQVDAGDRVLEIGTGSGYQAAILRELTDQVYTVEIIPPLAATAAAVLARLGYGDIRIDRRDGYFGWAEHAPFDAIVVTAAPDHLPNELVQQLKPDGGRMVIPIGPVGDVQTLWLVTRVGGETKMERVLDVRFVPFTREGGPTS